MIPEFVCIWIKERNLVALQSLYRLFLAHPVVTRSIFHAFGFPRVWFSTCSVFHVFGIPDVRFSTRSVFHAFGFPRSYLNVFPFPGILLLLLMPSLSNAHSFSRFQFYKHSVFYEQYSQFHRSQSHAPFSIFLFNAQYR